MHTHTHMTHTHLLVVLLLNILIIGSGLRRRGKMGDGVMVVVVGLALMYSRT